MILHYSALFFYLAVNFLQDELVYRHLKLNTKGWICGCRLFGINDPIAKNVFVVLMNWCIFETFQMLLLHALIARLEFNVANETVIQRKHQNIPAVAVIEPGTQ